jgi:hypothetical protein
VYRTLTLNLTTVDNEAYGIVGGSSVTLFVVYGNVGRACPTTQLPSVLPPIVRSCTNLATGMREFLFGMGQENVTTIGSYVAGPIETPGPFSVAP